MKFLFLITAFLSLANPSPTEKASFILSGKILDKETDEPVSFTYIHIEELNRTSTSNEKGDFKLENIPKGDYTLSFHRLGYKTQKRRIEITDSNLNLTILLTPTSLTSETIEVIGVNNELTGANLGHASKSVSGSTLRRNLGTTLANTLANLPGIDQRSLGNTPSRPVIRGLGDERLIILQDGLSTGDVSDQSSDHSVSVDPIASSEIEIAKGPAALEYGSNAVGGIVNVVNNLILSNLPSTINGTGTFGGESVNKSASTGLNLSAPVAKFAINLQANGRFGNDTETPLGPIKNTDYRTTNSSLGISYIRKKGYLGGSFGTYLSNYGIPPDPNGHPDGVDIEMRKFNYTLKGELIPSNNLIKTIEGSFTINNYNHKEFETTSSIGTEFGLVTTTAEIKSTHGHIGIFDHGNFGISTEIEDYAVNGANTPDANSYKFSGYLIEEFHLDEIRLETGLRFDYVSNAPKENDPNSDIGNIRQRDFSALSSSASLIYNLGKGFSVGGIFLHSFRAPSLEELYSEGPHLASFSFEIGNPELEPERSFAKELFTRFQTGNGFAELAVFHNKFSNFIYAKNTGMANSRFPTLNNYQFTGTEAELYGFEVSTELQLTKTLVANASTSFTIGRQDTTDTNGNNQGTRSLPQIPPFKAKASLKYVKGGFEMGSRFKYSAEQNRIGAFETSTDSYFLTDFFAQYRFNSNKFLHTISLNVNNILDEEYYNHLSRIKDLRPEPGRNITLLYKIFF